jgi:hypothetical protein
VVSSGTFVLLITIDSLRRDHLGCYGGQGVSTAFIDRLSSAGVRYENAFTQGGGTPESFPSIMCSLPPPMALGERRISGARSIAKLLKEEGYNTAAFHSNPFLSSRFGYSEGFDMFYEGRSYSAFCPIRLNDFTNAANLLLLNRAPITEGPSIVRMALEWLRGSRGPVFLWVHFMDTHFPYLPPLRSLGVGESMANRFLWGIMMASRVQNRPTTVSERTKRRIIRSYDACVSLVDESVSVLVSYMLAHYAKGLIVLTSDHGEGFWEHGYFGHSGLYEEILRVPLLVYTRGGRRGAVDSRPSLLSDIMPTVEWFVRDGDAGEGGLLSNSRYLEDRKFVCTSLDPPMQRRSVGLRASRLKYIRNERIKDGGLISEELYDLVSDPLERVNLSSSRRTDLLQMRQELEAMLLTSREAAAPLSYEEESEIAQRLRSLGYD